MAALQGDGGEAAQVAAGDVLPASNRAGQCSCPTAASKSAAG